MARLNPLQRKKIKDEVCRLLDLSFDSEQSQNPPWQTILVVLETMADNDFMGEIRIKVKNGNAYGFEANKKVTPGLNPGVTKNIIERVLKEG